MWILKEDLHMRGHPWWSFSSVNLNRLKATKVGDWLHFTISWKRIVILRLSFFKLSWFRLIDVQMCNVVEWFIMWWSILLEVFFPLELVLLVFLIFVIFINFMLWFTHLILRVHSSIDWPSSYGRWHWYVRMSLCACDP